MKTTESATLDQLPLLATSGVLLAETGEPGPEIMSHELENLKESRAARKIVALLAEDNRADALIIEEAIEAYDLPIDLHTVTDGQQAIDFIKRAESDPQQPCPQLLLLDLNLPKRSGLEILKYVRSSTKWKDIPVVVITSLDSPRDRSSASQLGANTYFRKPTSYEGFLKVGEVLRDLLQPPRT